MPLCLTHRAIEEALAAIRKAAEFMEGVETFVPRGVVFNDLSLGFNCANDRIIACLRSYKV
jgi:hypothetical protein